MKMARKRNKNTGEKRGGARSLADRTAAAIDKFVYVVSPQRGVMRAAARQYYDVLDGGYTRKPRTKSGTTGDVELTEMTLAELRDKGRDAGRNNPIAKGLLKVQTTGVIGSAIPIQARTSDKGWNEKAEKLWKAEMIDRPCDVTGRYNFIQYTRKQYKSSLRDGDSLSLLLKHALQACEGDQLGTPWSKLREFKNIDVVNGIAVSKKTGRVIGYFIGKPDKWGFIKPESVRRYTAEVVHHMFNADRFSHSRAEPIFTSCFRELEQLNKYIEAEQVKAIVNACYAMFVSRTENYGLPTEYLEGASADGIDDETKERYEKLKPGKIMYGRPGETAIGIGPASPGMNFDPFVMRMLGIIGRPMCMPLMLVSGDFSGATYMNARLALDSMRDSWKDEQEEVVKPFVSRVWRWFILRMIDEEKLGDRQDKFAHEIFCRRWPYVDPFKDARADQIKLTNRTDNRTNICANRGDNFEDVNATRAAEDKAIRDQGVILADDKPKDKDEKNDKTN
jgi:lambda family phage portal protein